VGKSIPNFAGGRLTFLKLNLAPAGFGAWNEVIGYAGSHTVISI